MNDAKKKNTIHSLVEKMLKIDSNAKIIIDKSGYSATINGMTIRSETSADLNLKVNVMLELLAK